MKHRSPGRRRAAGKPRVQTSITKRLLIEYPNIHILAVSIDGSRIRVEWMEHKEEEAENLSLEDFIEIFESFESDPRKRSVLIGQS